MVEPEYIEKKEQQENIRKKYFCRPIKRGYYKRFLVFAYSYNVEPYHLEGLVVSFNAMDRSVVYLYIPLMELLNKLQFYFSIPHKGSLDLSPKLPISPLNK